jgi:hypothetical protein
MLGKGKWRETLHKVLAFFSSEEKDQVKKKLYFSYCKT